MKRKVKQRKQSVGTSVVLGVALSVMITIIICAVTASMIDCEAIDVTAISVISPVVQFASTAIGGMFLTEANDKRVLICVGIAAIYYLLLAATTILLFGGVFRALLAGMAAVAVGATVPILLKRRKSTRGKGRRKMYAC